MTPERALALRGEDLAHRHLQRVGYRVVARNYRPPHGGNEVDLIAWHGDRLVFVEVKTRMPDEDSSPERAVNPEKQRRISFAALDYARRTKADLSLLRFDIVTVTAGQPPQIGLYQDAFSVPRTLA